jgi:glucoamylase
MMTNDRSMYRWLPQQGEAPGNPGLPPRWTSAVKDAVGTAYSASSRMWFTCSHGIVNELYHPTIDMPQVRDLQFLLSDGETFVHEEKRDMLSSFEYIDRETLGVRYTNSDPDGRYTLTKEIICDPHHSVLLIRGRLEADPELLARLKMYALLAPHLGVGGANNSAQAVDVAGYRVLLAWHEPWALAMGVSCGFARVSCGFVGASDGWQDLKKHLRMEWEYGSATDGNIAITGELNLACGPNHGADDAREFTLAVAIGDTKHTALQKTVGALVMPYEQHRARFIEQWRRAANPEWLAEKAQDGGKLMRASHNVLLAHEDKKYSGAFVASASIPWGNAKGDDDLGGYHLVWTRDMVQTASAMLACGRDETARRALVYLACTQQPDGGFAQNFWVDGQPYWTGVQLDEVAFPIILAWRLWKAGGLGELHVFPFVERAAGYLLKKAPITHQERWEENAGYSPSTLAAVIAALICAADITREFDGEENAEFLEDFADWIEGHLEDWTVTNDGILHPDVKRHYMRVRPPESGEAYACESCGTETIRLANQAPGSRYEFAAREIIDHGFLELVRYGIRRADDPLIADSLKVVDRVLRRDLPQGTGWLRYNFDGYGNRPNGGPFEGWGQGRVWPLLTGERAHYELAAGKDISGLIHTYERFATAGQLLPEQVWDEENRPHLSLVRGMPAGSATPLVWAHAEYLKLLRSARDGKVFDRVDCVYERYCTPEGRAKIRRGVEYYSLRRPIQKVIAGQTLRIVDGERFEVLWSADDWQTTQSLSAQAYGSAGFAADLPAGRPAEGEAGQISWTLHWPDSHPSGENLPPGAPASVRWLGYNVTIEVVSE